MEITYPELKSPFIEGEAGISEQALIILKPDALENDPTTQEVLRLFKEQHLDVKEAAVTTMNEELVNLLYEGRISPDWTNELLEYLTQGPSAIFIVSGIRANEKANYIKTLVRRQNKVDFIHTMVHASDTEEEALKERKLFFKA